MRRWHSTSQKNSLQLEHCRSCTAGLPFPQPFAHYVGAQFGHLRAPRPSRFASALTSTASYCCHSSIQQVCKVHDTLEERAGHHPISTAICSLNDCAAPQAQATDFFAVLPCSRGAKPFPFIRGRSKQAVRDARRRLSCLVSALWKKSPHGVPHRRRVGVQYGKVRHPFYILQLRSTCVPNSLHASQPFCLLCPYLWPQ